MNKKKTQVFSGRANINALWRNHNNNNECLGARLEKEDKSKKASSMPPQAEAYELKNLLLHLAIN